MVFLSLFNILYDISVAQYRLSDLFVSHPQLSTQGQTFVQGVTKLMERLLDYRTVVQGDDNIDNRMSCTVNVLVSKPSNSLNPCCL